MDIRHDVDAIAPRAGDHLERRIHQMRYRGRLAPSAYADITVFDPTTIIDRATYLNSAQYSEGVHYVLVSGTVVLDRGEFVAGAAPVRPIRRESRGHKQWGLLFVASSV